MYFFLINILSIALSRLKYELVFVHDSLQYSSIIMLMACAKLLFKTSHQKGGKLANKSNHVLYLGRYYEYEIPTNHAQRRLQRSNVDLHHQILSWLQGGDSIHWVLQHMLGEKKMWFSTYLLPMRRFYMANFVFVWNFFVFVM